MADDEDKVQTLAAEYGKAVTAGDLDRWMLIFEEGATYHAPDLPALRGRESISKWAKESFFDSFDEMQNSGELEVLELADNWAAGSGPFRFSGTLREGGEVPEVTGHFMAIYRKQSDSSWKISQIIYNWDAPM